MEKRGQARDANRHEVNNERVHCRVGTELAAMFLLCSGFDREEVSQDLLPFSGLFSQERPLSPSSAPLTRPPSSSGQAHTRELSCCDIIQSSSSAIAHVFVQDSKDQRNH